MARLLGDRSESPVLLERDRGRPDLRGHVLYAPSPSAAYPGSARRPIGGCGGAQGQIRGSPAVAERLAGAEGRVSRIAKRKTTPITLQRLAMRLNGWRHRRTKAYFGTQDERDSFRRQAGRAIERALRPTPLQFAVVLLRTWYRAELRSTHSTLLVCSALRSLKPKPHLVINGIYGGRRLSHREGGADKRWKAR